MKKGLNLINISDIDVGQVGDGFCLQDNTFFELDAINHGVTNESTNNKP